VREGVIARAGPPVFSGADDQDDAGEEDDLGWRGLRSPAEQGGSGIYRSPQQPRAVAAHAYVRTLGAAEAFAAASPSSLVSVTLILLLSEPERNHRSDRYLMRYCTGRGRSLEDMLGGGGEPQDMQAAPPRRSDRWKDTFRCGR
jgi:hypothetical protein